VEEFSTLTEARRREAQVKIWSKTEEVTVLPNGKKIVKYKEYKTPLKKLLSLVRPGQYLRSGITLDNLNHQASAKLPNQAAEEMQEAKRKLFSIILPPQNGML